MHSRVSCSVHNLVASELTNHQDLFKDFIEIFLSKRQEDSYKTQLFNSLKLFEILSFLYYGFTLNLSVFLFSFFSMPRSCVFLILCADPCLQSDQADLGKELLLHSDSN